MKERLSFKTKANIAPSHKGVGMAAFMNGHSAGVKVAQQDILLPEAVQSPRLTTPSKINTEWRFINRNARGEFGGTRR